MDVKRPSATFKIVAQNSYIKEAILEFDDFGSGLAVLWRRTVSGSSDVKIVLEVLWSRTVTVRKNSFCGSEQSRLATSSQ